MQFSDMSETEQATSEAHQHSSMNNLSELLRESINAQEDLTCYGFDASVGRASVPLVWAEDVPDVVRVMQFAHEHDIAVIPAEPDQA